MHLMRFLQQFFYLLSEKSTEGADEEFARFAADLARGRGEAGERAAAGFEEDRGGGQGNAAARGKLGMI